MHLRILRIPHHHFTPSVSLSNLLVAPGNMSPSGEHPPMVPRAYPQLSTRRLPVRSGGRRRSACRSASPVKRGLTPPGRNPLRSPRLSAGPHRTPPPDSTLVLRKHLCLPTKECTRPVRPTRNWSIVGGSVWMMPTRQLDYNALDFCPPISAGSSTFVATTTFKF